MRKHFNWMMDGATLNNLDTSVSDALEEIEDVDGASCYRYGLLEEWFYYFGDIVDMVPDGAEARKEMEALEHYHGEMTAMQNKLEDVLEFIHAG